MGNHEHIRGMCLTIVHTLRQPREHLAHQANIKIDGKKTPVFFASKLWGVFTTHFFHEFVELFRTCGPTFSDFFGLADRHFPTFSDLRTDIFRLSKMVYYS